MSPVLYIIACLACFLAGILVPFLFRKKRIPVAAIKSVLGKIGTMNLILIILAVSILVFVLKMIQLFELYGAVPDTLIIWFFTVVGGECGAMAWIRTNKENNKMRKWQLEDQKHEEEKQKNLNH